MFDMRGDSDRNYSGNPINFEPGSLKIAGGSLHKKAGTIASAVEMDLSTMDGDFADVSGGESIEYLGDMPAGIEKTLRFTGGAILTTGNGIIVPGGSSDIQTYGNDCYTFRSLADNNWQVIGYASGDSGLPFGFARGLWHPSLPQEILGTAEGTLEVKSGVTLSFADDSSRVAWADNLYAPRCVKFAISLNTIKALGAVLTGHISLGVFNTAPMLFDFAVKHTTALAGPSLSAATARLNFTKSGSQDWAGAALNVFSAVGISAFMENDIAGGDITKLPWRLGTTWGYNGTIRLYIDLTGCNANALTAGAIDVWITAMRKPA